MSTTSATATTTATTTAATTPAADAPSQREALEQSERAATEQQPDNFRDEANAEKIVEIGPDKTDDPIKHIDPPESPGTSR